MEFQEVAAWIVSNPQYQKELQKILSATKKGTLSSTKKQDFRHFPDDLIARFKQEGKEEVAQNIWMTKDEFLTLQVIYGEEELNNVLVNLSDWSTNPNPDKTGKPAFLKFRTYVDHYRLTRNSLKRNQGL